MARQLIFTSAPQGLTPGRSGFCTVARHNDIRDRLVSMLESLSVYPSDWQPPPVICAFRVLDLSGTGIPVLTRIVQTGHDYTHRTNYLAHHLILDAQETINAPCPAELFLQWDGWLDTWEGNPCWLNDDKRINLKAIPPAPEPPLPAKAWKRMTLDAGRAALLVEGKQAWTRLLRCPVGAEMELLSLFRESSALLPPGEAWRTEFTTCIQPTESAATFKWCGLREGSSVDDGMPKPGLLLDLTQPESLPVPAIGTASRRAREGTATLPTGKNAPVRTATAPPKSGWKGSMSAAYSGGSPAQPKIDRRVIAGLAALIVVALAALAWFSFGGNQNSEASNPLSSASTQTPAQVSPNSTSDFSLPKPGAIVSAGDAPPMDVNGHYLDALARWKQINGTVKGASDIAVSKLLPGARKEWLDDLDQMTAQLNAVNPPLESLTANLETMRTFPRDWPLDNPASLERAWTALHEKVSLVSQLPAAPTYLVDTLKETAAGSDYHDYVCALNVPELNALLATKTDGGAAPGIHASWAPAISLMLPPKEQWFNFDVKAEDFTPSNYLMLHDATRGKAGGRFLQLVVETQAKVWLSWRAFTPESDFYKLNTPNALLVAPEKCFWLRFASDNGKPIFYLLVFPPPGDAPVLKPVQLPIGWLTTEGSPAKVALPGFLANNLRLHAPQDEFFRLTAPGNEQVMDAAFANEQTRDSIRTPDLVFQAAWVVSRLTLKAHNGQTELARAKLDLNNLLTLAEGANPATKPVQADVDHAREAVDKLTADIASAQASAQAVANVDWPASVAPWTLVSARDATHVFPLLEFKSNATGTTP